MKKPPPLGGGEVTESTSVNHALAGLVEARDDLTADPFWLGTQWVQPILGHHTPGRRESPELLGFADILADLPLLETRYPTSRFKAQLGLIGCVPNRRGGEALWLLNERDSDGCDSDPASAWSKRWRP